jgi:hypothetical protein
VPDAQACKAWSPHTVRVEEEDEEDEEGREDEDEDEDEDEEGREDEQLLQWTCSKKQYC